MAAQAAPTIQSDPTEQKNLVLQADAIEVACDSIDRLTKRYAEIPDPVIRHGRMVDKVTLRRRDSQLRWVYGIYHRV